MAKVKPKKKQKKDEVFCDPAVCDDCLYICEGDFLCEKYQEIVVGDWEPTAHYMMCRRRRKEASRMPTEEELFAAVRLIKEHCEKLRTCDVYKCPLWNWCNMNTRVNPENWIDPELLKGGGEDG